MGSAGVNGPRSVGGLMVGWMDGFRWTGWDVPHPPETVPPSATGPGCQDKQTGGCREGDCSLQTLPGQEGRHLQVVPKPPRKVFPCSGKYFHVPKWRLNPPCEMCFPFLLAPFGHLTLFSGPSLTSGPKVHPPPLCKARNQPRWEQRLGPGQRGPHSSLQDALLQRQDPSFSLCCELDKPLSVCV